MQTWSDGAKTDGGKTTVANGIRNERPKAFYRQQPPGQHAVVTYGACISVPNAEQNEISIGFRATHTATILFFPCTWWFYI